MNFPAFTAKEGDADIEQRNFISQEDVTKNSFPKEENFLNDHQVE